MKAVLRSQDGKTVYQIRNGLTTVGRDGNDINLQQAKTENQHALIEFDELQNCFVLQDLNSAHGTYVNECRVQNAAVRLAHGDLITFGHGTDKYEFQLSQGNPAISCPPLNYVWDSSSKLQVTSSTVTSTATSTCLPYISLSFGSGSPLSSNSQRVGLPVASYGSRESQGFESMNAVMPHPPLRSRPASATISRTRPSSAGRERTSLSASRGGWMAGESVQDLEHRLLQMGDELSRLASYEQECHRKDGVITTLRDEISELKALLSENQHGFRGGGSGSAFTSTSVVAELGEQNSQLQSLLREKEENERNVTQKLATYQNQLHIRNEEVASLQEEINSLQKRSSNAWVKPESDASTNTIASLRTEIAEKIRKISHLESEIEKLNKHKIQTTTLMNSLQRENSAKDTLFNQTKSEISKLKRELKEKEATISTMSAKLTRQKAAKEAECEADKKERELTAVRGKLQTAEKQLKDKNKLIVELQGELDKTRQHMASGQKETDLVLQQELNHAKSQCLDAQRAEKLLKVDFQHLDRRFDRFRKKVIQNMFIGEFSRSTDHELEDEELLDYIKELAQERDRLAKEVNKYTKVENKKDETIKDLQDAASSVKKYIDRMERHLVKSGRSCKALEEELNKVEELIVHDSVTWVKEALCKIVTNELAWQQKTEEALLNAGIESENEESSLGVKELCEQLKKQKEETRKLQAKISEMEETHHESLITLREDLKREEEKHVKRAVSEVREEEEERRFQFMQEQRVKERERIQAAVDAERKILESQQGSVSQLRKVLEDKELELESFKSALTSAKVQYQQAREALQRSSEVENELRSELREKTSLYESQLANVEKEKEMLKTYKQDEVQSFKEQTRQHAVTIVAMEDRLMKISKQNKQLELELNYAKQQLGGKRIRPASPKKDSTRSSPKKETSPRPQSPRKENKPQTRTVETETVPQSNIEAALQSDIYKLEQLVLLLRREAAQAKKEAEGQNDVVQALRRDLAGASARMSDMAGELSDKQKQKLEEYAEKIRLQDDELAAQRKQLIQLSALVDEQRKEIDSRDDVLSKQERALIKQKQNLHKQGSELVEFKEKIAEELEEQKSQLERIEQEGKTTSELHTQGAKCRGERHDMVIARQREALAELRQKMKGLEQLKPPFPSHEQALQQVVQLKKELSEARAQLAVREEDFHRNESELQGELRRNKEIASSTTAETNIEKSAHRETKEALEASEKTYLKVVRALSAILELDLLPGCRSMAHLPGEERDRLEQDRTKAMEMLVSKVKQLNDRISRQDKMLSGYEVDLAQLSASETIAGQKTAEATGLKMDVRNRQQEIAYLRESLSRLREELDQERRLNVSLKQRKKFAMDMDDRAYRNNSKGHSCYVDEHTTHKEELKHKKMAEKIKRKNYEIESLKKELQTADKELNETAAKLLSLETSATLRDSYTNGSELGENLNVDFDV